MHQGQSSQLQCHVYLFLRLWPAALLNLLSSISGISVFREGRLSVPGNSTIFFSTDCPSSKLTLALAVGSRRSLRRIKGLQNDVEPKTTK
ncbi:hypothetical protein ARMGADRAFT_1008564 [Armillaria gallica]|uniref:Uncharacterized protein n=1 Tax=Armillaria gallica TaxID=47427 RepID=A0A2H3E4E7_ARMGA|nr:hypothetical protein ARMGADRAFT_1008564 [Armillaria gallica]